MLLSRVTVKAFLACGNEISCFLRLAASLGAPSFKENSSLVLNAAIEKATIMAKALNRTPPKQIEHWAKISEIMEDNPDLPYEFVRQAIIAQAERDAGKLEAYDFG